HQKLTQVRVAKIAKLKRWAPDRRFTRLRHHLNPEGVIRIQTLLHSVMIGVDRVAGGGDLRVTVSEIPKVLSGFEWLCLGVVDELGGELEFVDVVGPSLRGNVNHPVREP